MAEAIIPSLARGPQVLFRFDAESADVLRLPDAWSSEDFAPARQYIDSPTL